MDFQSEKSFGKLSLRAFQPYHQILYMLTLSTLGISISNAFNAIYVNTLDTKHCRVMKTNGMVFRYTWVYSKEDTMAHTCRPMVAS